MRTCSWSAIDRERYISDLSETTFAVLIVGGGITGAGILRECGLHGISAALIEKDDFAFGTSSKSSKLAHGGVRYILNREFGLVREETHERDWLRRAFPNIVRPVPIIFPNYTSLASIFGPFVFWLYDALAGWRNYRIARFLTRRKIMEMEPHLNSSDILSGMLFYECVVDDARLTIEVVKEGVMLGGKALNYVKALRILKENNQATGVEAQDRETGRVFTIKAKNVINATGSWTDKLLPDGYPPSGSLIRPSKGVHIAVRREKISNNYGLYATNRVDKRGVFIVSHGDFTYVGTTDTEYSGDLDHCHTDVNEYEYLKGIIRVCFPDAQFELADLVGSYAGTRPLVNEEGVSEHKTSRKAFIDMVFPGFFIIAGGKLTTFRAMAEKIVSFMAERNADSIPKSRRSLSHRAFNLGTTRQGWTDTIRKLEMSEITLDEKTLDHLYENYGGGSFEILGKLNKSPGLADKIADGQPHILAEVDYAIEFEMIVHVKDFLMRRTNLSLHERDKHLEIGLKVARHMAYRLGWEKGRTDTEVADYIDLACENRFFINK
jgi:glycerol-3-phosphate dehydrogenase